MPVFLSPGVDIVPLCGRSGGRYSRIMVNMIALNWAAFIALMPAALLPLRRTASRDKLFWAVLALAAAGPLMVAASQLTGSWHGNLSTDLWVGIGASLVMFAGIAVFHRHAWQLAPLLLPYLALLGLLAAMFAYVPGRRLSEAVPTAWIDFHILVSMLNLALLTVAASAALASFFSSVPSRQSGRTA